MKINAVYKPALHCKDRYLHLYGGAGSGKSHFAAQKVILRCLEEKGHRFLGLRKVGNTIRNSVFKLFKDVIDKEGLNSAVTVNKSEMAFYFDNGNEIQTSGLDDVEKLKSITGITGVWVEEPTEIKDLKDFQQIDLRLRGETDHYKQIILTYNPIDPLHWLKDLQDEYEKGNMPHMFLLRTSYMDNRFAGDEYGDVLSSLDDNMQKVYKLGKWGDANAPNQLIKIEWVKNAKQVKAIDGSSYMGIDVARYGDDKTVFGLFVGNDFRDLVKYENQSITETARRAFIYIQDHNISDQNVGIDTVGMGAGVYDALQDDKKSCTAIESGSEPIDTYQHKFYEFKNLRTQMWWAAREALRQGDIRLSVDNKELIRDLTSVKYEITDKKIFVHPKDKIKKDLGRSTDYGDAFVYANAMRQGIAKQEPWVMWA